MKRFYLAHPFDSRERLRKWELKIEKEYNIELINPFYDRERQDVLKIDEGRAERYEHNPNLIVEGDLNMISKSDGIIAIVDGSLSYGTIQEFVYAYLFRKPLYAVISNGHHKHPWLTYHSTEIFTTLKELEQHLNRILK